MNIIKRIRTKVLKVKQAEMAEAFGVNASTICRWERDDSEPGRSHILTFAKKYPFLGVAALFPELRK